MAEVEEGLERSIVKDQLVLIRYRNCSQAFSGELCVKDVGDDKLLLAWANGDHKAELQADLKTFRFSISLTDGIATTARTFG
jgi:sucrose phosphorylase